MSLEIIVLAAGEGKRMHSALPKVLHPLAGRPLLAHVLDTVRALAPRKVFVVHGHGGEQVKSMFNGASVEWVEQAQQLGTGHAVMQALPRVDEQSLALVVYGDVPLIRGETLRRLADAARGGLALLTAEPPSPDGYGRIVRSANGAVERIVEHKDASPAERAVREINAGFLAASKPHLAGWLAKVQNRNVQGEYYLTDVIGLAVGDGVPVTAVKADWHEVAGVNSRHELAQLERAYQATQAARLLEAGVALADPARVDIRGVIECGRDVSIDVNCVFEGRIALGDGVRIGPNCVLRDTEVAAGTEILAFSMLESARVGERCRVGPYARLRPGANLGENVHIGNFVEVKESRFGAGAKANHLSYIGDADVGARANIGAGTITCNYDGAAKHRTVIEDDCFIGSDATLVAPVRIARGSYIGAGSTINKDTPPDQLTVARSRQVSVPGWRPPKKKE
jgi:bifunctional UDP-N-acetylglucosamine pyrophosphorylase / glucosamine-1-phosphate N-acetyltransferase